MNPSVLGKWKEVAADYLYKQLVSTDKSEDYAVEFLKMRIRKRRLTYNEIRKIANYFANSLAEKVKSLGSNLNPGQQKRITQESLDEAWERYSREING